MSVTLRALPLSRERFAAFGDVIETCRDTAEAMNDAHFERFDELCRIDVDGVAGISIARCRNPKVLPLRVDKVERHPLGSQAFIPLSQARMLVVVAPPREGVDVSELRAFVTNGRQGFNYHRGTWHMPLVGFEKGQEYLIVDRCGAHANCDVHDIDETVLVDTD